MNLRQDIQALRGLAVLLVVVHHAEFGLVDAGYLGVDVFFVVSGFLITGLITSRIESGRFSFADFYFRRAKRLLPAAYVTFVACAALAPWLLGANELRDFWQQLIGSTTFTANFVLWQQAGYFQGAAALKPLLHVWSLAIEEQYYLILPLALTLMPRRSWLFGMGLACLISVIACLALLHWKPIATFYLLPTRAWELAMGSVGTLIARHHGTQRLCAHLYWPAIAVLLVLPVLPLGLGHPGPDALLICTATLIVLLRAHEGAERQPVVMGLARIGDMSYSLYLVHWPILAFGNNIWVGQYSNRLPPEVRAGCVLAAFAIAYALYRWIEHPLRRASWGPSFRTVSVGLASSLALIVIPARALMLGQPGEVDYTFVRRSNLGLATSCDFADEFVPTAACITEHPPQILVWGDSFAMHLMPALLGSGTDRGLVQATRSSCGPLQGMAPIVRDTSKTGYQKPWAESCIRFNDSVLKYLERSPSIQVVVLSSQLRQYLDAKDYTLLQRAQDGSGTELVDAGLSAAVLGVRRTVAAIRALGRRVVWVAPPPADDFDIGACLERLAQGKPIFGAPPDCRIRWSNYQSSHTLIQDLLAHLPADADVDVLRFDELLCDERHCQTRIDGEFIYRDFGHLSVDGARRLGERFALTARVLATAR
ncbi:MAG: hypothetical protein IOMNBAOH_02122 [Rhodocyclaceae bacterium]|nr:hypothetical protein [Rhodocyclaceae bacterium]